MSRVRRVSDEREMDELVDEFVTRGYRIESSGRSSTRLRDRDWGDAESHVVVAALTIWWTFGLMNALYALYRHVNADEVIVKIDDGDGDE